MEEERSTEEHLRMRLDVECGRRIGEVVSSEKSNRNGRSGRCELRNHLIGRSLYDRESDYVAEAERLERLRQELSQ